MCFTILSVQGQIQIISDQPTRKTEGIGIQPAVSILMTVDRINYKNVLWIGLDLGDVEGCIACYISIEDLIQVTGVRE